MLKILKIRMRYFTIVQINSKDTKQQTILFYQFNQIESTLLFLIQNPIVFHVKGLLIINNVTLIKVRKTDGNAIQLLQHE